MTSENAKLSLNPSQKPVHQTGQMATSDKPSSGKIAEELLLTSKEWTGFLDQCKSFPDLENYAEELKKAYANIISNIEITNKNLEAADTAFDEAREQQRTAETDWNRTIQNSQKTYIEYDRTRSQFMSALEFLQSHESQGGEIRQAILLQPHDKPPTTGDYAAPSMVCDPPIPLFDRATETFDMKFLCQKERWKVDGRGTDKLVIADKNGKAIIVIERGKDESKDKIEIKWTDEVKKGKDFDPSVNDVRFSVLVITHTVSVGTDKVSRTQYRPLFDADPDLIKKIFTE